MTSHRNQNSLHVNDHTCRDANARANPSHCALVAERRDEVDCASNDTYDLDGTPKLNDGTCIAVGVAVPLGNGARSTSALQLRGSNR